MLVCAPYLVRSTHLSLLRGSDVRSNPTMKLARLWGVSCRKGCYCEDLPAGQQYIRPLNFYSSGFEFTVSPPYYCAFLGGLPNVSGLSFLWEKRDFQRK